VARALADGLTRDTSTFASPLVGTPDNPTAAGSREIVENRLVFRHPHSGPFSRGCHSSSWAVFRTRSGAQPSAWRRACGRAF